MTALFLWVAKAGLANGPQKTQSKPRLAHDKKTWFSTILTVVV